MHVMDEQPEYRPRFPVVAAVYCAACLAAAAWMWMRYSYAWDVSPWSLSEATFRTYPDLADCSEGESCSPKGWPLDGYVTLHGTALFDKKIGEAYPWVEYGRVYSGRMFVVHEPDDMGKNIWVHCDAADPVFMEWRGCVLGRVHYAPDPVTVDMTSSRFHPASIAGLMVGAMGLCVFGMYLLEWLAARGRPTGESHVE